MGKYIHSYIKIMYLYTHRLLSACLRGKAKAGKKQKVGGSSEDPKGSEPEKQTTENPEAPI